MDGAKIKEPTRYHKASVESKALAADKEVVDIKQKIRDFDRTSESNLYGKYKK